VAKKFAKLLGMDPWLINPMYAHCGKVDWRDGTGLDCVQTQVDALLSKIRRKHKEYGINEKPFVVVKADNGTSGRGIMTVRDVKDVEAMRSNCMAKLGMEDGRPITQVIIQEGVLTNERINDAVAEPVVYMMDRYVVGGFYRVHADRGVDDPGLVDAELHLAGLDLADRLGDVGRHGAGLRVRHQAARAEHLAEFADGPHHVRRRDDGVEVHPTSLDLRHHIIAADNVRSGLLGLTNLVAAGNDQHALGLAEPVREDDRAADHLVGMLRVHAKAHMHLDGLVELGKLDLLDEGNRLFQRVRLTVDLLEGSTILFSSIASHVPSLVQADATELPRPPTELGRLNSQCSTLPDSGQVCARVHHWPLAGNPASSRC
jgi:hypothetical protein